MCLLVSESSLAYSLVSVFISLACSLVSVPVSSTYSFVSVPASLAFSPSVCLLRSSIAKKDDSEMK